MTIRINTNFINPNGNLSKFELIRTEEEGQKDY